MVLANAPARLKVDQVRERIRSLIFEGKLSAGQRLPSDRDLAEEFGVSAPTVNKAMAYLQLDGLLDRKVGQGTFVREGLSMGSVAVVFDWGHLATGTPFYESLMKALLDEVSRHRMRPQFILGRGKTGCEFNNSLDPASPLWRQVTGVIAMGYLKGFEEQLAENGKPTVTLSAEVQGRHCILFDYPALIRISCEHLATNGYRRIALISGASMPPGMDASGIRSSFESAVADFGLQTQREWAKAQRPGVEGGASAMRELWSLDDRPEAIVVADDNMAVGVGRVMTELGIRCPEDVAVIAHGTLGVDLEMPVAFTRCSFDLKDMCTAAWLVLDGLVAGDGQETSVTRVTPTIVIGKTT